MNIHQLIEARAAQYPERIAIEYHGVSCSYASLFAQVNDFAEKLSQHNVAQEELIGIHLPPSLPFVIAMLGVMKSGAAFVPIEHSSPQARVDSLISRARLRLVVSSLSSIVNNQSTDGSQSNPMETSLAYVIFTSGSTGEPKGAMIEHPGLLALIEAERVAFDFQPFDRVLQFASTGFDVSVFEILTTLAAGATLCIPTAEERQIGPRLLRYLQEQKISIATLLPTVLATIPNQNLPALRIIVTGGEPCPQYIVDDWARGRQLFNAYGPTEATIGATFSSCAPGCEVTIGRPFPHVSLYLLDESRSPVAPGEKGEIYLGGVCVGRGYLFDDALTQQKFISNPFAPGRLYKTGDFAKQLPTGEFVFLGRIDEQIKHRGVRIELGEIESALLQMDGIKGSAVLVEGEHLVAFYLGDLQEGAVVSSLRARLPAALVPGRCIKLNEPPRTINSKWDKAALRSLLRSELHRSADPLTALFSEILSRPIGSSDNFFHCGGDSLLAAKLLFRLGEMFPGVDVVSAFFRDPTPGGLSSLLSETRADITPEVLQVSLSESPRKEHVILTGATGYLGIFVLQELQEREPEIVCLVRASSVEAAWARLQENAERFSVKLNPTQIKIGLLDLAAPLSLSSQHSSPARLYHCAARVDLLRPYSMLRAENVLGVASLLSLCSKETLFHFVSSYSALSQDNGYGQSKFAAEELIRSTPLRAVITRPTFIIGGEGQINQRDLFFAFLRESLRQRKLPELGVCFHLVSVEEVSRQIVSLSPGEYNLCSRAGISCEEMVSCLQRRGLSVSICSLEEWRRSASEEIQPHVPYLSLLATKAHSPIVGELTESTAVFERYLDGCAVIGAWS
jgi:amino acid adenylation domain-containing protein